MSFAAIYKKLIEGIQTVGSNVQQQTSYDVTALVDTTHTFSPAVNKVLIINNNPYCGITAIIDGGVTREIPAAGKLKLIGQTITEIKLRSHLTPCNVTVIGGMDTDVTAPTRKSKATYSPISTKNLICTKGAVTYYGLGTSLYRSTDNMKTFSSALINITPDFFSRGIILSSGTVLAWTNGGKLYRSTDGTTFTEVDVATQVGHSVRGPQWHGVDSYGNVVVWAEYGTTVGNYYVYRSGDGGVTWSVILTKLNPDVIRHFHSVNFNRSNYRWIVTSGDSDSQVRWWYSADSACTLLNEVSGVQSQKYRTLNVITKNASEIIWSADSDVDIPLCGIYKALLASADIVSTTQLIFQLPAQSWSIVGLPPLLICSTAPGDYDDNKNAEIYVSTDGGNTWTLDLSVPLDPAYTNGGIKAFYGPDAEGKYYFYLHNILSSYPNAQGGIMQFK